MVLPPEGNCIIYRGECHNNVIKQDLFLRESAVVHLPLYSPRFHSFPDKIEVHVLGVNNNTMRLRVIKHAVEERLTAGGPGLA